MDINNFILGDKDNISTISRGKRFIIIVLFMILLLLVFVADDFQQRQFERHRTAYKLMEENKYAAAKKEFTKYISCESELYWKIIKENLEYEYTCEGVHEVIRKCQEKISEEEFDNNMSY